MESEHADHLRTLEERLLQSDVQGTVSAAPPSMDEHPNARLIRAFYEARGRGDREAIRRILASDVECHDPYPPPHGGDLTGIEAVLRDMLDAAAELTGGSTRLWLEDVLANDRRAVALVGWSSRRRLTGRARPFEVQ